MRSAGAGETLRLVSLYVYDIFRTCIDTPDFLEFIKDSTCVIIRWDGIQNGVFRLAAYSVKVIMKSFDCCIL